MRLIGMRRADPFISGPFHDLTPPSHSVLAVVDQPIKPIPRSLVLYTQYPHFLVGPCPIQIFFSTSLMYPAQTTYKPLGPSSIEFVVGSIGKGSFGGHLQPKRPACCIAHSARVATNLCLSTHDRLFNVVSGVRLSHCSHFSIGQCLLHFRYRDQLFDFHNLTSCGGVDWFEDCCHSLS